MPMVVLLWPVGAEFQRQHPPKIVAVPHREVVDIHATGEHEVSSVTLGGRPPPVSYLLDKDNGR